MLWLPLSDAAAFGIVGGCLKLCIIDREKGFVTFRRVRQCSIFLLEGHSQGQYDVLRGFCITCRSAEVLSRALKVICAKLIEPHQTL